MRKILALVISVALILCLSISALAEMTDVGTPRNETLIMETQTPTDVPGQFNPYMLGTQMGFGIHQLITAHLWEIDTALGEQFGEVAAALPEANEDYTEFTVKIREGLKWSDGEDLNADDVVFTMNMIKENSGIGCSAYTNSVLESVEKVDDYTVKFHMVDSFPRLSLKFGVTIWGCDYYIVPEHIYSKVEDVTQFKDSTPVTAGPYTVKDYDPNGQWILYQLREDWTSSTLGIAGADHYGITADMAPAKYVWCRVLGDDTTRQMAMINNQVDLLCEVTPEILEYMVSQNNKIACWYDVFPYATSDDPCSKGIGFGIGNGAPYDSADFRWGVALAMDFDEISLSIFDGAGRASVFPIITATSAGQELYYKPLLDWLQNEFELDLGDGTTTKVWDPDYAKRMAGELGIEGTDEELIDMFGVGCWKYNPEAAEKLFIKAGLEKKADGWYFDGKPFVIHLTYLADTEAQAGRGVIAAYDQLTKFGFNCEISSESSATWDTINGTGEFELRGIWPTGFITKDVYDQISGWDADLIKPVGELGSGQGTRWNNAEATEILHKLAKVSPDSEESYQLGLDFLKVAIKDMPFLGFHSGVKFVPTNSTIWEGYPNAANAYNGPWWWWSCFKYIAPYITLVK
ncbi:MAG: ABC transporter substrate-binding protein [Clostridia bacterium]|nr:ABC transporter substrate-binding protein [Clostridia bacterium]